MRNPHTFCFGNPNLGISHFSGEKIKPCESGQGALCRPLVWPCLGDLRFLVTSDVGRMLARRSRVAPGRKHRGPHGGWGEQLLWGPPFTSSPRFVVVLKFLQEEDISSLRASRPLVWGTVIRRLWPGTTAWHHRLAHPLLPASAGANAQRLLGPTTVVTPLPPFLSLSVSTA